jgi:hypothetical protein
MAAGYVVYRLGQGWVVQNSGNTICIANCNFKCGVRPAGHPTSSDFPTRKLQFAMLAASMPFARKDVREAREDVRDAREDVRNAHEDVRDAREDVHRSQTLHAMFASPKSPRSQYRN